MGVCGSSFQENNRPPREHVGDLFAPLEDGIDTSGFQKLICCPSAGGVHIVQSRDFKLLYKVKASVGFEDVASHFILYPVQPTGHCNVAEPLGHLTKTRMALRARCEDFEMLMAWRIELAGGDMCVSVHFQTQARRKKEDGNSVETWLMDILISDDSSQIAIESPLVTSEEKGCDRVLHIHRQHVLVCVAKLQSFGKLKRANYRRPFMGVLVKSRDLLPLLLALAWGEEVMSPPHDLREHFMSIMRQDANVDETAHSEFPAKAAKFSPILDWEIWDTAGPHAPPMFERPHDPVGSAYRRHDKP